MNSFDWESFLWQWSHAVIESMDDADKEQLPLEILESGWLGYPGATEDQIVRTEARLQLTLPPSYRDFLKVTNGWRQTAKQTDKSNHRLWSVEDLELFINRHPQWIHVFSERQESNEVVLEDDSEFDDQWRPVGISDDEYFVYGEDQDPSKLRLGYLKSALEISDVGFDSIYLLNPQVIAPDGEWEAWFFADYLPGADRYRSFREMMEAEYRNFLEFQAIETDRGNALTAQGEDLPADNVEPLDENAEAINWRSQKRIIVELQSRQIGDQAEYRTVVNGGEWARCQAWSGIGEHKLRLWLRDQLMDSGNIDSIEGAQELPKGFALEARERSGGKHSPSGAIHGGECMSQPKVELDLEVVQLVMHQPANRAAPLIVKATTPQVQTEALLGNQPFSLEVNFQLLGQDLADLPLAEIYYKVQAFGQSRITHQGVQLGTNEFNSLKTGCLSYTSELSNNILEPGIYRLQVIITLAGAASALSTFNLPLLSVI